jgi:hypothetical protein
MSTSSGLITYNWLVYEGFGRGNQVVSTCVQRLAGACCVPHARGHAVRRLCHTVSWSIPCSYRCCALWRHTLVAVIYLIAWPVAFLMLLLQLTVR